VKTIRVALTILFLLTAAGATTVIPMSVEDLTRAASSVVEVEVTGSWSAWNSDHSLIYTYSRVRVARALKGGVQPEMIVEQLGGSSEGYIMKVAGVHALNKGEHAVLFLRPARANGGGSWTIVGLMQGHFKIYAAGGNTMVSNGLQVHAIQAAQAPDRRTNSAPSISSTASTAATSASSTSSISRSSEASSSANWAGPMTMQELESRVRGALNQ
jgi:hypothetical protein